MDLDYYTKYLKYKQKYIELKSIIGGNIDENKQKSINELTEEIIKILKNYQKYTGSNAKLKESLMISYMKYKSNYPNELVNATVRYDLPEIDNAENMTNSLYTIINQSTTDNKEIIKTHESTIKKNIKNILLLQ
jgi:hypothetical protein